MASILIRNLDEETKGRLRMLAAMHGRSMEAEVREILRYHLKDAPRFVPGTPPSAEPEVGVTLATGPEMPSTPRRAAPPPRGVVIEEINRQLERLGMSEFALPADLPL